jgi:hypothetical protein
MALLPDGHVVNRDLECASRHKLTFNGVADEEEHHAGVHLVLKRPDRQCSQKMFFVFFADAGSINSSVSLVKLV